MNDWRTVGIRTKVRPMERAAFFGQFREKKLRGVLLAFIGVHGNAATRLDAFVAGGGVYTYGSYPDIEGLIKEQRTELDPKKREATLHRIQQLTIDALRGRSPDRKVTAQRRAVVGGTIPFMRRYTTSWPWWLRI